MKKLTLIITFLLININLFSQTVQNNYSGKFYVAEISASCKEMVNGGCMIYGYCVMKFDKDSVEVSYPTKASCSPSEVEKNFNNNNINLIKKYKWIIKSDKLDIKGFEDLNKYSFSEKNVDFVKNLYTNNLITLDKSVKKTKTIRGFVFENAPFVNTPIPVIEADITIKGTETKTKTNKDGKFEIQAKEEDELVISGLGIKNHKIFVTVNNCYIINLDNAIIDYPFMYPGKDLRRYKKNLRKIEKEVLRKKSNGFYDCIE